MRTEKHTVCGILVFGPETAPSAKYFSEASQELLSERSVKDSRVDPAVFPRLDVLASAENFIIQAVLEAQAACRLVCL